MTQLNSEVREHWLEYTKSYQNAIKRKRIPFDYHRVFSPEIGDYLLEHKRYAYHTLLLSVRSSENLYNLVNFITRIENPKDLHFSKITISFSLDVVKYLALYNALLGACEGTDWHVNDVLYNVFDQLSIKGKDNIFEVPFMWKYSRSSIVQAKRCKTVICSSDYNALKQVNIPIEVLKFSYFVWDDLLYDINAENQENKNSISTKANEDELK